MSDPFVPESMPAGNGGVTGLLKALGGTWVGLVLLGLLVVGLSVASIANRPLQVLLDTTETGVYGAWPLAVLWLALCVNIALASLFRIPFRWDRLGAHLAHAGVLVLAIGSLHYWHNHVKGDVQVPRLPDGFPAISFFYDGRQRAMLVDEGNRAGEAVQVPLTGLPLHQAADNLSIPIPAADQDMQIRVTAYRPRAIVQPRWREGDGREYPAAQISLNLGLQSLRHTLVPDQPVWDLPQYRIEFRPEATPDELAALRAAGGSVHTLTIEGPGGFRREETVVPGDALELGPLGYRVVVLSRTSVAMYLPADFPSPTAGDLFLAFMPAATGADDSTGRSPTSAATQPVRPAFLRRVGAAGDDEVRDIPLGGTAATQPAMLLAPDIKVTHTFRDISAAGLAEDRETLILLCGPQVQPALMWFDPHGPWAEYRISPGAAVELYELPEGLGTLTFKLEQLLRRARLVGELMEDLPQVHQSQSTQAVRVELRKGDWSASQWLPLEWQSHLSPLQEITTPAGQLGLQFTRLRRSLGATLHVQSLEFLQYPGTTMPRDYICHMKVLSEAGRQDAVVRLNEPLLAGDLRISQSGWDMEDPEHPSFTILGVASRPGIGLIWAGCVLIGASMPYAFYIKPLLQRRHRQSAGGGA